MPNSQSSASTPTHVSVIYGDGSHTFWLAPGALIGELALHIGGLDFLHDGAPLSIDVSLSRPRLSATTEPPRQWMNADMH